MTWMLIRLVLSLAFVAGILVFAARLARKKGLGGTGNGLVEVVATQRVGRASTVNVIRVADRVLVIGSTEQTVTLLTEMDGESLEVTLAERELAALTGDPADGVRRPLVAPRSSRPGGALAGSVFDRGSWGGVVQQLRERTVRR